MDNLQHSRTKNRRRFRFCSIFWGCIVVWNKILKRLCCVICFWKHSHKKSNKPYLIWPEIPRCNKMHWLTQSVTSSSQDIRKDHEESETGENYTGVSYAGIKGWLVSVDSVESTEHTLTPTNVPIGYHVKDEPKLLGFLRIIEIILS